MITQKMKYALKSLLVLGDEARRDKPEALTIEDIARRSGPPASPSGTMRPIAGARSAACAK